MSKLLFFLLVLGLNFNLVYGQKTIPAHEAVFANRMTLVVDADSIKAIKKEMLSNIESKSKVNSTKVAFDLNTKWTLKYLRGYDWTEAFPNRSNTVDNYLISKEEILMTGDEIFAIFKIDNEEFPLNFLPQVYERGCLYNGEWTATLINDNLFIRYVHSYPNGNQTSWYREKIYYFQKH